MVQTSISAWLKRHNPQIPVIAVTSEQEDQEAAIHEDQAAEGSSPTAAPHKIEDVKPTSDETRDPTETSGSIAFHRPLPSNVQICAITTETLPLFKRLISVLLPVPYSDSFYKETLYDPVAASVSLIALWQDDNGSSKLRVVSGIRCRVLARSPAGPEQPKWKQVQDYMPFQKTSKDEVAPCLYISTIGTLAPYRNIGLAATLLRQVIRNAVDLYDISSIAAHVWEASDEARAWYVKLGFKEVKYETEYYRRLSPNGAWVVERPVRPSDLLGHSATESQRSADNV
jgi:ribosomal protein S18 acetylase RimI-like enzyme